MTLQEYLKIFRHRWLVIAAATLVATGVTFLVTPASGDTTAKVGSYTATATMLVGVPQGEAANVSMGRIPLFLTTGEIPKAAAAEVGYEGDPALLAAGLTVEPDMQARAITISATASDGDRAAAVANAFAGAAVDFFEDTPEGAGGLTLSVLQEATPIPNAESSGFVVPPGRGPRTAIGAVLGLLTGLALALVLDRLDSRLRSRKEIHDALHLPVIAEVPRLTRAQRGRGPIAVLQDPLSAYADSYRAARTAVVHTTSRRATDGYAARRSAGVARGESAAATLILVTSAHASEGKTTSVANLAASFAETGQQVLVLDVDLRSPDTHNLFDVPQGAGISDYLSDPEVTDLEALVRPTSVPGVRIMTAGTRLANPASLASRLGNLLLEARGMADVVLLDSAPLLEASDVFDVLPMVDTVLLVVRSGRLTEPAGHRVSELLGRFQVPVSGVIIVGVARRRADAYGYGYGEPKQKKKQKQKSQVRSRRAVRAIESSESVAGPLDDSEAESRRARRTSSA